MKRFIMFILSIIIFVSLTGCSSGSTTQRSSVNIEDESKDYTDSLKIDLDKDFENLALCFDVRISDGDLNWRVLSPKGEVVQQGKIQSGESYRERLYFSPRPGRWVVEVDGNEIAGKVEMEWIVSK
ncbi:hypothetical protein PRVXT_002107 [Proteinivorax tanatarense]|uniref:Lipoprotein n=1 Tax=Proteinivorax tanatarense TaxID=1260629 RepID=A0AAU7VIX2_9FIRM